jgi:hypothetical protein
MSQCGASWWTDLAVVLAWRLTATGAELAAGRIDLARARLIAEATRMLTDEAARAVEEKVLPAAGDKTTSALRAALRREVIIADPEGVEERRKQAERQAKVSLYPDEESTATLAGQRLPAIHAAAAMARITAMAQAWKASGGGGPIDLLRARVYLGLLLGSRPDDLPRDDPPRDDPPRDGSPGGDAPGYDVPPPGDQDAPRDDEDYPCPDDCPAGPAPEWPDVPADISPAFTPSGNRQPGDGRPPAGGMLDVSMPWQTLAGISPQPGWLGRIGPVSAAQACRLADLATRNPAAEWRIIVTAPAGHAIAVTRIPRPRERDGPPVPVPGTGLVSRVTLTIPEDILARPPSSGRPLPGPGPDPPAGILARALRAAAVAADRARAVAQADAAAGGCAHQDASPAYRPPARLRDYVTARDLTCRYPTCRQPAWRGDLDHTIPFEKSHLTCSCNLGGLCRTHHIIKQHLCWSLHQTAPGTFRWTTPSGRAFTATPDVHPV